MSNVERGWLDDAQEELEQFREKKAGTTHLQKMINTILALVDAKLAGTAVDAVFKRKECCSHVTYYTKWNKDKDFVACLTAVTEIAQTWSDGRALRAIKEASNELALLTPLAVKVVAMGMKTSNHMETRLRAAFGTLDRAGLLTAVKSQHHLLGGKDVDSILEKLTTEELERFGNGDDLIEIILDRVVTSQSES